MPPEQASDHADPIPSGTGTLRHRIGHSKWVAAGASVIFFSVGLTAIVVALVHSARQSNVSLRPGVAAFAGAVCCMVGGHLLAARGWVQCFEGRVPPDRLTRAYYSSQLGKYVPGGIWQPVSQVLLVGRTTSALHRTAAAYAVFIWTFVVSCAAVGGVGLAATATDLAGWMRVLIAAIGVVTLLGLRRAIAVFVVERMPARIRRGATADDLPTQPAIVTIAAAPVAQRLSGIVAELLLLRLAHAANLMRRIRARAAHTV